MTRRRRLVLAGAALAAVAVVAVVLSTRAVPAPPIGEPAAQEISPERESIRKFWESFRRAEAARLSGSRERLAEAEFGYREALALDPDHENSLWGLANVLVDQGRRAEGMALLRRHLEAHPRSTRGYARLGDLLSASGPGGPADLAEAERMYRRALELNPEESGGYLNLGRLLYSKDDLDGAEAQFRSALKINFKSLLAARYLAVIALRRNDPARAGRELIPVMERVLADKPRLYALSEGDTIEKAEGGRLTPSAREILPAAAFVWMLVRSGGVGASSVPAAVHDLISKALPPMKAGGLVEIHLRAARGIGSRSPAGERTVVADLDGDEIADRFSAGQADAAEAAAWILNGEVLCGARAAAFEKGIGGGRYQPPSPEAAIEACLPAGRVTASDVDGDGDKDLLLEAGAEDPVRVEPDVVLLNESGRWSAAVRTFAPRA